MAKKLILSNINDGIIRDGFHYYPIPVTKDHLCLDIIQKSLFEKMSDILDINYDFLTNLFPVVGSWGMKPAGANHKDLDLICELSVEDIQEILEPIENKFFYKGLSTFTFLIEDAMGIPRKIDIFKVEDERFSKRAYDVPIHLVTDWPAWTRNMLLNAVAKVKLKDGDFTGRFIPYRGLCLYNTNKESKIYTTDWQKMLDTLGFTCVDKTEDILKEIKAKWCDREKDEFGTIINRDKKLNNLLHINNKRVLDIYDEIY